MYLLKLSKFENLKNGGNPETVCFVIKVCVTKTESSNQSLDFAVVAGSLRRQRTLLMTVLADNLTTGI